MIGRLRSLLHPHDATRMEVTARIFIISCISFCLSIADIPNVVPISTSIFPGIVGPILAVFPSFLFAIGLITPTSIVLILFTLVAETMLLAASTPFY
jgi:hypothetical protein